MAGFLTPLDIRDEDDGRHFTILTPFEYCLKEPDSTERVIIPVGFVTDFASIPRALWAVLPPNGRYGKAAVVHDWLYQHRSVCKLWPGGLPTEVMNTRLVDRGEADHILLEAMQVLGVGWFTRSTIYAGVRSGGWATWAKYRHQEEKQ